MYRVKIPGNKPDVEKLLDTCIKKPFHTHPIDNSLARKLGYYLNEDKIIDDGVFEILYNRRTRSSKAVINTFNVKKQNGKGKSIEYIFGDKYTPKIDTQPLQMSQPKIRFKFPSIKKLFSFD